MVSRFWISLLWFGARAMQADALSQRAQWAPELQTKSVPPRGTAPFLALGYTEAAADAYWAVTLGYYGSSIRGDESYRYLESLIDTVIDLDPHFEPIYEWAPYAVTHNGKDGTATQKEIRLSIRYLERAMTIFPDRYEFPWTAGQRYFFDLQSPTPEQQRKDRARGAALVEIAVNRPDAPEDLANNAAFMHSKLGQEQRALAILREKVLTTHDKTVRDELLARLRYYDQSGAADEIAAAEKRFRDLHRRYLRDGPEDLFVIIGPKPSAIIDFDKLATRHDLFGSTDRSPATELFSDRWDILEAP